MDGIQLIEEEEPLIHLGNTPIDRPPPEHVKRAVNDFFNSGNTAQEKKVWIVLEDNTNIPPTGQVIGLNGRMWMLRAGVPAEVPLGIINVLNDAVEDVPETDPVSMQVVAYRKKLRFPYRLVTPVS